MFDAHVDAIGFAADLGHDLGTLTPGQFDLVRAAEGGLGTWVVVCWPDPALHLERSFARTSEMLVAAHALAERHPARFRLVGNGAELDAAHAAGAIAGIAGIEGGHALEQSLAKLEWFFERGLRVMTLVWNNHLAWIRSCQGGAGPGVPEGLSSFGHEVVRRMNELGIVVDLSHAGERSFFDALETSTRPAMASHSGCKSLHDHPRNLSDEQMRALAQQGGVVGIVFHPGFLDAGARAEEARVRQLSAYAELREADPAAKFLAQQRLMRAQAAPLPAGRLVEHVEHAVLVAGIDHVGLGSDYDGIERAPEGLEDARGYAVLAELLARRGFGDDDLVKILGGNMERVFRAATGAGTRAAESHVPLPLPC
ncbi:MAG: membrane dipeptidase [Planctomycetes bacterium]|nr:membrane dipeptidase [Planctomycetota bacterium]